MTHTSASHHRIAIIGAGFGGIGLGLRLRQQGERDFVIFDKAAGVGGTWWVNRYPGCACDVPSHLYSFSFAPNPDWTRHFAPRDEIQAYLAGLVADHGLEAHLRLSTEIIRARWGPERACWRLESAAGGQWTARYLVSAVGPLARPKYPDIPGLGEFGGTAFHSQHWPENLDLGGKRVAAIGTGATAAQLVPEVAGRAASLAVYQRTPAWIIPRRDRPIPPRRRARYRRWPWLQKLARFSIWAMAEMRVPAFVWWRGLAVGHRALAHWHRRRQIDDPALARHLKPDYDVGCKRVILSSDFYPALNRDHVELVTDGIERIERDAVVTRDGRRRPADVLVLATGFSATEPVPRGRFIGRDGRDLAAIWRDGPQAYKGTAVAGFPNLFLLLGPNTGLGHNSVIILLEAQIRYLLAALDHARRRDAATLEVDARAQADWNRRLARRLRGTVWNDGGCRSWYLHPRSGRNTTIWPGFTRAFDHRLAAFDPEAYRVIY